MPYDFVGENLVYIPPPEVTGYTWTSSGGGADTAPTERWEKNPDFDINSILDIKTDKYGRSVSSLKADASEADKRAYNLSRNYDPSDWQVKTEMQTGVNPDWENIQNQGFWDVDPAIQERWQAANRANSGNAVGMSGFKDWIVPLSILAAGAGTAIGTGALAGGAAAGEAAGALTTAEILSSTGFVPAAGSGASFTLAPGAAYTTATAGAEGLLGGGGSITSQAGQQAFFDALASGANSTEALNVAQAAQTAATNTGTLGMEELLGLTDQAAADANWEQLMAEYNQAGGYAGSYSPAGYGTADGYALGNAAEIANFTGEVAASGLPPSTITQLTNLAKQYGPTVAKALLGTVTSGAAGRPGTTAGTYSNGGLLGSAGNFALNQYQLGQLQNAYNENVTAQKAATQTAQQQASFTPVGMTTTFGQSNFQYDPTTGKMVSAGYTPSSQVSGLQNALLGQAATIAQQAGQVSGQIAPMQAGAQSLFGLANQFLPTSSQAPQATAESQAYYNQQQAMANAARPSSFATTATPEAQALYNRLSGLSNQVLPTSYDTTAAAQKYMQQQQNLLAPGRQQTLSQLQAKQYGAGTSGLATGGTAAGYANNAQGLLATNPQMAAYYNAMAQQDAQLAAAAEQQARTNLQSDITLGANLGTQGLSTLTTSQQQALQNALAQGQFAQTAGGAGLSALTSSQQQQYANMMNNLQAGTNLYGAGAGLLTQGQTLQNNAYAPLSTQLGLLGGFESLAQQPLSLSTTLGTAGATAGAKSGYYGLLGNQAALATQLQGQQANIYGQGQAITAASQPLLGAAGNVISEWLK